MDRRVEQQLGACACEGCGVDTYEANLACHACGHRCGGLADRGPLLCSSGRISALVTTHPRTQPNPKPPPRWEACVVSGYPVVPGADRVVSKTGRSARREDWNAWVGAFGTDPETGLPATPLY